MADSSNDHPDETIMKLFQYKLVQLSTLQGKKVDFTQNDSKLYKKLFFPLDALIEAIDDGNKDLRDFIPEMMDIKNPEKFLKKFV